MSNTGLCTLEDVRRALQKADLPGDVSQDEQIAVDAITSLSEWLEKTLKRHYYASTGDAILNEATQIDIPTAPKTRDDEYDIPTGGAYLAGADPTPKTSQGSYAKLELNRRDATAVTELLIRTGDGSYEDWVGSSDYDGGSWPDTLGDDYYLRINNGGWTRLYIDTENLLVDGEDDEYVLDSFANAVYLSYEFGHDGIPDRIRNGLAAAAAARFAEEAVIEIPANATVYNVDTKADELRAEARRLLGVEGLPEGEL